MGSFGGAPDPEQVGCPAQASATHQWGRDMHDACAPHEHVLLSPVVQGEPAVRPWREILERSDKTLQTSRTGAACAAARHLLPSLSPQA